MAPETVNQAENTKELDKAEPEVEETAFHFSSPLGGGTRPPIASYNDVLCSGLVSFFGIGTLSLLNYVVTKTCDPCTESDVTQIVGSYGAASVLLYAAPGVPLAQV